MAKSTAKVLVVLMVAGGMPLAARASDLPAPDSMIAPISPDLTPALWGWEIRGGALAHDATSPEGGSVDLNGEVLAPKWYHISNPFWDQFIPHADAGFTANFVGKTSNLYAGAAWNFDITQKVFLSADFGLGVNDGKAGRYVPEGYNSVGCNWWFHESGSVGYRLSQTWSVMATVEHSSNAGFCVQNRGLTNYGLRIGYSF